MTEGRIGLAAAIGAALWMALIFVLSSVPGGMVPGRFGSAGHFVLYAVLGGLYYVALLPRFGRRTAAIAAVALASAYGVTDEFHQVFTPGRMPDPVDWLVDTAGALAAVAMLSWATGRQAAALGRDRRRAQR